MHLHRPAAVRILLAKEVHHQGLVRRNLVVEQLLAGERLAHRFLRRALVPDREVRRTERMVGQAAAHARKVLDALRQRLLYVVNRSDIDAGRRAQLLQVGRVVRIDNVQRLLRAEGRQHAGRKALILRQHAMVIQVIDRVVGRAERTDVALGNQRARRARRALQFAVRGLPYHVRSLGIEQLINPEKALQFQMRPVVDRVADQAGHNFREAVKLIVEACAAGHILFRHRIGTHHAPLVMIARQPCLADVCELLVFVNLCRVQMAVIVENRHFFRMVVIQPARCLSSEQEILANKALHLNYLTFCAYQPTDFFFPVCFL